MKGISLPINTVIIISLAILVLVFILFYFITGTKPFDYTKYENAIIQGCDIYMKTKMRPEEIEVGDINGDGLPENLLNICRVYYSNSSMSSDTCIEKCKERYPKGIE